MTTPFIHVTDKFYIAPQLQASDIDRAAEDGFTLIINNRPDGEMMNQPLSADLEAHAQGAGMAFANLPVDMQGITEDHINGMIAALNETDGKVLGFCKAGPRALLAWCFAQARLGMAIPDIIAAAANAGMDISGYRHTLETAATAT